MEVREAPASLDSLRIVLNRAIGIFLGTRNEPMLSKVLWIRERFHHTQRCSRKQPPVLNGIRANN